MPSSSVDLADARVLISNDDGIHAPGLRLLEKVMRRLAREVWVVAPDAEQSAASHSLTMRRPLSSATWLRISAFGQPRLGSFSTSGRSGANMGERRGKSGSHVGAGS